VIRPVSYIAYKPNAVGRLPNYPGSKFHALLRTPRPDRDRIARPHAKFALCALPIVTDARADQ
jgi:hypothetical protein